MFVYWMLFAFFAAGVFMSRPDQKPSAQRNTLLFLGGVLTVLIIGLRNQVGADWPTYQLLFDFAGYADLGRVLDVGDPGYQLLNWIVQQLDGELWLVNLLSAALFVWGLHLLCRIQPDPWLAYLVAVPYLVIVVAMGYTRQAVALGVLMAGLASVQGGGSVLRFSAYVAVAALFHRTAVVVLPLVIFASERNRLLNAIAGLAIFVLLYDVLVAESVGRFVKNYIEAEYSSQGAAIRVVMSLVPASVYLLSQRRFQFSVRDGRIWRYFSLSAWLLLALLVVLPSSTAVDRMALYITPLQVVILSRMPGAFASTFARTVIVAYSFFVLFVWLNFATHAKYWVPYRFVFQEARPVVVR